MAKKTPSGWDGKPTKGSVYKPGTKTPASGQYANRGAPHGVKKDYGKGLPPPGPSSYIVTTPNFLPFGSDEDSNKGK